MRPGDGERAVCVGRGVLGKESLAVMPALGQVLPTLFPLKKGDGQKFSYNKLEKDWHKKGIICAARKCI